MILKAVFIRFYKSFNYDYLRKNNPKRTAEYEWEKLDDLFYPFVRVPIDKYITTIVGANESGKTHLLTAIEKGIRGEKITRDDFCRYSQFFTVEEGKMRWPEFGFEWAHLTSEHRDALGNACGIQVPSNVDRFLLFRKDRENLTVFVPSDDSYSSHNVTKADALFKVIPSIFRLQESVALPESVPIRYLTDNLAPATGLAALSRQQRTELLESLWKHHSWFQSKDTVVQSAEKIATEMAKVGDIASREQEEQRSKDREKREAEQKLAYDLIRKVAQTDGEALRELLNALRDGRDAFANSIIDKINTNLQKKLNFPRWWAQDREFRLLVSPRDHDLAFVIRDKTGKDYAFGERSGGLRYFLSYYIQYLAHDRSAVKREILLMDEPDAYLSHQGQQDLLKIFDAFAKPDSPITAPIQVIYVTHSPFLIDKNHGERIRVLEKGIGEEGTRVVRDASRNHYEPLRSAFGSFVGETTFIGNCNLIVEGPADQILLAGAAAYLRSASALSLENLDLNHITIVPASGAAHVPYLVYLARGRDVEKPAIIVLLDSDKAGNDAKKGILRGGPNRKQLLKQNYVIQLGDLSRSNSVLGTGGSALVESEDLVPLELTALAVQRYLRDVCDASGDVLERVTPEAISRELIQGEGSFCAIERCLSRIDPNMHIEKVGFARAVIETITEVKRSDDAKLLPALHAFQSNMKFLFRLLCQTQRSAERELISERLSGRVNRAKAAFIQDHPEAAKREQAIVLFEEIESILDNSEEADVIRLEIQSLLRDFKIDDKSLEAIENYAQFKERLDRMSYAGRLATQGATLQEAMVLPPTQAQPSEINVPSIEAVATLSDSSAALTAS